MNIEFKKLPGIFPRSVRPADSATENKDKTTPFQSPGLNKESPKAM